MLSKSRFLSGRQCRLRLWYQCYNPGLASEVSPAQQFIFDTGHEVGNLATRLFPEGIYIKEDHLHHQEAVQSTLSAIGNPDAGAIFEAAFLYDDIRVRVDILERAGNDQWDLVEVKSSTSVKEIHLPDVAVQYYVLCGSGINIRNVFLMHINNQYIYDGNHIDITHFLLTADLTEKTLSSQREIALNLSELKEALSAADPPDIRPSRHCNTPYPCEFWGHCTGFMPKHWIMELSGIAQKKLDELTAAGITAIQDIPAPFPLSMIQERIKNCVIKGEAFVSEGLEEELRNVEYPVHFLDFETVSPAIPRYAGTRPYQTTPFQWSDHILYEDGTIEHREFLCEENTDPRAKFAQTLIDVLGKKGTVFIYTAYEKRIIEELAGFLPEIRDSLLISLDRLKDLCALIRNGFYHPDFHGSFSLKSVLPAIVPDMNYGDLTIQEGSHASFEYLRLIDPFTPPEKKRQIRSDLLKYCGYDTLGMLKIREELVKRF